MDIKQIYELVNTAFTETVGTSAVLQDDLGNLVDVGTAVFDNNQFDAFTQKLLDRIAKTVFVNRKYDGVLGNILKRDGWEYGAVLMKISSKTPRASANESWQLQDGASYDPWVVKVPDVQVKFFNKYITFEVDSTITEKQLKTAFTSAGEMNAFISMLFNEIEKSLTVAMEDLSRRTLCNAIAETMYTEYNSGTTFNTASHTRAVNLLYEYNNGPNAGGTSLTAAKALSDPAFLKYAAMKIGLVADRITEISTLFNGGAQERFTPKDKQQIILLSEYKRASDAYLESDTYHNELVALPETKTVAFWQGSGTDYAFSSTGKVYCTTTDDHAVTATGVLAVLFDRDAMGINSYERTVRSLFNPKGEYMQYFYKEKAQFFNDFNENFIVFFVA